MPVLVGLGPLLGVFVTTILIVGEFLSPTGNELLGTDIVFPATSATSAHNGFLLCEGGSLMKNKSIVFGTDNASWSCKRNDAVEPVCRPYMIEEVKVMVQEMHAVNLQKFEHISRDLQARETTLRMQRQISSTPHVPVNADEQCPAVCPRIPACNETALKITLNTTQDNIVAQVHHHITTALQEIPLSKDCAELLVRNREEHAKETAKHAANTTAVVSKWQQTANNNLYYGLFCGGMCGFFLCVLLMIVIVVFVRCIRHWKKQEQDEEQASMTFCNFQQQLEAYKSFMTKKGKQNKESADAFYPNIREQRNLLQALSKLTNVLGRKNAAWEHEEDYGFSESFKWEDGEEQEIQKILKQLACAEKAFESEQA